MEDLILVTLAGPGEVIGSMLSGVVNPTEPAIRVFHHWACSGGTLLSRCLAIQPQVVLMSEVHPLAYLRLGKPAHYFSPTDLIQQLCLPHNGRDPAFCVAAWNGAIDALHDQLVEDGMTLILRSHSHVDFFTGVLPETVPLVSRTLARRHPLLELLSVRHPLDSWLSICQQGWDSHFCFSSFPEFCRRCLAMLDACEGMAIMRYEDFCLDPPSGLNLMAQAFELTLEPSFLARLDEVQLSGDSGRTHSVIGRRPRRPVPADVAAQLAEQLVLGSSESPYVKLCMRLGYDSDPERDPFTSMQPLDQFAPRKEETKYLQLGEISLEQRYFDRYNQQAREFEHRHQTELADLNAKVLQQQQELSSQQQDFSLLQEELEGARSALQRLRQECLAMQAELQEMRQAESRARHSYRAHFKLLWAETVHRLRSLKGAS